jgi:hypothetical protein
MFQGPSSAPRHGLSGTIHGNVAIISDSGPSEMTQVILRFEYGMVNGDENAWPLSLLTRSGSKFLLKTRGPLHYNMIQQSKGEMQPTLRASNCSK